MSIANRARERIMREIKAAAFHAGMPPPAHMDVWGEAEDKINAMSNMELLELLGDLEDES